MNKHEQSKNKPIVGVFLGGKTLRVGKVTNNQIEKSIYRNVSNREAEEVILKELITAIDEVFDDDIAGIGIGVPSLVNVKKGIVYKVVNIPSWKEVHLKEILEDRFGVNVYVNNDANCFAIGEKYFGKAKNYENIVGLIIGAGMGTGIIFNGHLFSGENCGAGEFGSIPYKEFDYEYYCSEGFFEEKYGLQTEDLFERAKKKDKIAFAIFEQFGYNLGSAIKTIMFSVDPELVVIGGNLARAFPYFEKAMREKVKTFPYKHSVKRLKIVQSEEPNIAILGAAALYLDAQNRTVIK